MPTDRQRAFQGETCGETRLLPRARAALGRYYHVVRHDPANPPADAPSRLSVLRLRAAARGTAVAFLLEGDIGRRRAITVGEKLRFLRRCQRNPTVRIFLSDPRIGRAYGVGLREKLRLLWMFRRNARELEVLSSELEHVELAAAVLRIPPSVRGDVIECGCYMGGSSANLSLACALVGRRLIICDSFEGLPEPADYDTAHEAVHIGHTDVYYKGRFAASLELVKENLARYGNLEVCDFVVGFFDDSLRRFERDVVMGFLDVDLIDSLRSCITAIWPKLAPGCRLYVHEAYDIALVSMFFDAHWWQHALGTAAPGFVGTGAGLPLSAHYGSELGYAQKGMMAVAAPTRAHDPVDADAR